MAILADSLCSFLRTFQFPIRSYVGGFYSSNTTEFFRRIFLSPFWSYGPVAISSTSRHFPEPRFRMRCNFFHAPSVPLRRFIFFVPTNSRKVLRCLLNFDDFESGASFDDRSSTFLRLPESRKVRTLNVPSISLRFLANLGCLDPRATANYVHHVWYTLRAICYCAAISYRRSTTDVTYRSPERMSGLYHRYVSSSYGHQFSYIRLMQHQGHQSSLVHSCPYVQLKVLSISDSSSSKFLQSSSSSGSSSIIESSNSRSSSAICSLQVQYVSKETLVKM